MGDAQYFSEFECDPTSPIIGAYFGQEMKNCDLEGRLEPNLAIIDGPVHTAWDLGNQSNMAVWCFQAGDEGLRIIDFISRPGWFFKDYISELNNREYTGNDYLPHDAAVKSFETGLTRLETLTKAGRKPVHVPLAKVEDRIHAAQLVLPKCRFDSTKCEQGLAALREFRRDWDDKQTFRSAIAVRASPAAPGLLIYHRSPTCMGYGSINLQPTADSLYR